jgi:hypothetical protein
MSNLFFHVFLFFTPPHRVEKFRFTISLSTATRALSLLYKPELFLKNKKKKACTWEDDDVINKSRKPFFLLFLFLNEKQSANASSSVNFKAIHRPRSSQFLFHIFIHTIHFFSFFYIPFVLICPWFSGFVVVLYPVIVANLFFFFSSMCSFADVLLPI